MRSMMKGLALAMAFLMASAVAVRAGNPGNPVGGRFAKRHPRRNEVNQRVRRQRARVRQGVKSGKLTRQQADQLLANDRAVKRQEHADVKANGGYITKQQQQQLNQELNANSKMIHDEKNPAPAPAGR